MIDIIENNLYKDYPVAFDLLLKDQTTQRNILWAVHDYEEFGPGYQCNDEIKPELITGNNGNIIKPRVLKTKGSQVGRSKEKAEVFTPSWLCNFQNNIVDETWFGRRHVFNRDDVDNKMWEPYHSPIQFPADKPWTSYVAAQRMEITCGEAPYLVSRYDATTGEYIQLENRIGLLDRKMRVVGENTQTIDEWLKYSELAYKSIYG
ncbi:MAG: restriction endonuclease subunit M, partial [Prevotella sp.]|nr:restriction endonuclease subunit M [Prevotella sp.]